MSAGRAISVGESFDAGGDGRLPQDACGVAVGAMQWIPTCARAGRFRAADCRAATLPIPVRCTRLNLVQLVAPYLFQTRVVGQNTHELGLYVGAVPVLLCVWLLAQRSRLGDAIRPHRAGWRWRSASRRCSWPCGEYGGLYRLQTLVPLVNRFRFPCRAIVLVELCIVAGLAAIGWRCLVERWRSAGR